MIMDTPNAKNFCGGAFEDWLEVNLIDTCNGRCTWCIEQHGWHPSFHAPWLTLVDAILRSGKTNIILLGGEPTLHPDIGRIIDALRGAGRRPWVTTNGSRLTPSWTERNLRGVFGINVSIHHYEQQKNKEITGITLRWEVLLQSIRILHECGSIVRFNCNCIAGYIDSVKEIRDYIRFAQVLGVDKIRFAELKGDDAGFVDLAAILDHKYGLNDNPFRDGCNSDAVIDGVPVNFRQMCGLQTGRRPRPDSPSTRVKPVLYYDGKMYQGWQLTGDHAMTKNEIAAILKQVKEGKISVEEATKKLKEEGVLSPAYSPCQY
jgi:hypothetical protein